MTDSFAPDDPEAAERAVALLKSLSHVGRLRILCSLLDRDMTVGELSAALHEPQASVSQQLMRLRAEGLIRSTRHGRHVTNRLGRADIIPIIATLRTAFCAVPTKPKTPS
ncbi:ArsR/SmtB family transcription factor [Tabrizicola sp. BL-A-41-H6]|uniref:ArsR/SmtB family transcription factor n=1 Tax=Tabrizicola sp. BL-A-41-H6 TaxID=3421107 RepID=UPI003D67812F